LDFLSSSEDHGGINPQELNHFGISPKDLLDFSVNSNPFGPTQGVLKALQSVDISSYPDRECLQLREELAIANGVPPQHILVGNGTSELIWLVCHALLNPGESVLIVGPTFGEYRCAAERLGARVGEIRAVPPIFKPPLSEIIDAVAREQPRLVFLCNPNNPTGQYLEPDEIQRLLDACGPQTLLVLDEAYRAFASGQFFGSLPADNCLLLRSMTKDFAIAGLRLGYVLATPGLIKRLKTFQPAWSVNGPAQAAGLAALAGIDYYHDTLALLGPLSREFFAQLGSRGLALVPSRVHFGIIRLERPAKEIRARLMAHSIQVRDCTSFGLPEYIRVSTRLRDENQNFLNTLDLMHA